MPPVHPVVHTFASLIVRRVQRTRNRVLAMMARIAAGTMRQCRVVARPEAGSEAAAKAKRRCRMRGARRCVHGRGCRAIEAGRCGSAAIARRVCASQLARLLADPEMQRMLEADPRLARAMLPVLHMLGLDLATLHLIVPPSAFGPEGSARLDAARGAAAARWRRRPVLSC